MKNSFYGCLLAFQFFTILPIRKEFPMNGRTVPWMAGSLPLVGLIIGGSTFLLLQIADDLFSISSLMEALLVWLSFIVWTGGLHLDGWTDVSDAYFSYRDLNKRHEILKDPRVGAFGVLSLIVLLVTKGILLIDLSMQFGLEASWLILIPILSRTMMAWFLIRMRLAKNEGMAFYLRKHVKQHQLWIPLLTAVIAISVSTALFLFDWKMVLLIIAGMGIYMVLFKAFADKHFGGMTGDLLGASLEGGELWSLIMVWFYLSIVTG